MAETLEMLDNLILVLEEDTSKTVSIKNHLAESSVLAFGFRFVLENLGGGCA